MNDILKVKRRSLVADLGGEQAVARYLRVTDRAIRQGVADGFPAWWAKPLRSLAQHLGVDANGDFDELFNWKPAGPLPDDNGAAA